VSPGGLCRAPRATQEKELVRLRQGALRRAEAVLAYLARYTHRIVIPNSRLLGLDERGVTFRYKDYHLIAPHACGRTSLSPRRPQRRVRHPRSCQNHPVNGRRDDKLSTVIGDPPPVTRASASPTQATAPSNPHRRQTAHPAPRGSFLRGIRTPASRARGHEGLASETLHRSGRPSPRWRPSLLGWRAVVRIPLLVTRDVPGAELRALFGICHCRTSADGPSMSELGIPPSTGGSRARIFPILSHPCESGFAQIADEQLVG
jgi:hypothetical protein